MKQLLLSLSLFMLFAFQDRPNVKRANKTINDSEFAVGDVIKLPTINWLAPTAYGEINQNTKDTLNVIGDFLLKYPNLTVEVTNHTSYKGTDEYNFRLSQERAKAIVNYLVNEKKIDQTKITPKGLGKGSLLYTEEDVKKVATKAEKKALDAQNIRTELVVTQVN